MSQPAAQSVAKPTTDLMLQRGQLLERISNQRGELARNFAPVQSALLTTDRVILQMAGGLDHARQNPLPWVAGIAAGVVLLKPRRIWRVLRLGVTAWRGWQAVRRARQTGAAGWLAGMLLRWIRNRARG